MEEIGGVNVFLICKNDILNEIDSLGLYQFIFIDGWRKKYKWTPQQKQTVLNAMDELKNLLNRTIPEIEKGLKQADGLPECCFYKKTTTIFPCFCASSSKYRA